MPLRMPERRPTSRLPNFAVLGKSDAQVRQGADAAGLTLRVDEIRRVAQGLGRDPSLVEAFAFDAQWSEHCSYKSSRAQLKKLPTAGSNVVVGPGEDAGIVHLGEHRGERYAIVAAHESHNHPSQVVPFEGAATGVGGIVRDVLCMGATVVAVADALRFGRIAESAAHQRYVARAAVDGIAAYGNAIGVPNIAGDVYFHEGFDDNCLVNVVALGIVKESQIIHSKAPPGSDGWDIVLVGKATDGSGFGGASFSSVTLDAAQRDANKSAVQVPDPFLKNVIMRASYRVFEHLRAQGVEAGFKDLGAGGIMGCTAELCAAGGFGAIIDLDDVTTAEENLTPAVIAIGETQERLAWVVPPEITPEVLRIYNEEFSLPEIARGARAAVIGCVQHEPRYVMRTGNQIVMDVDIAFLTGAIAEDRPQSSEVEVTAVSDAPVSLPADNLLDVFLRVAAHRDVASRRPLFETYDGVVRGTTVLPRGNAAGVIAPIPDSPLAVALAIGGNPRFGAIDAYRAAELSVLDAALQVVATGAQPIALTDCLNFGNPQDDEQYGAFTRAVDGLAKAGSELSLPFISGNVSLYNESGARRGVPASAIIACIGRFSDVSVVVTNRIQRPGNAIFIMGPSGRELGGSVLSDVLELKATALPKVDYAGYGRLVEAYGKAAHDGLIASASAVRSGGAAACLLSMLYGNGYIRTLGLELRGNECPYETLFGETPALVVEADANALRAYADRYAVPLLHIADVCDTPGIRAADCGVGDARAIFEAWDAPLREVYS